ncbi:MAG TPA: hypothetical protein VFR99_09480 [Marmoricola sp.]|nr:hypothetical protein [Marmoricola sp.]
MPASGARLTEQRARVLLELAGGEVHVAALRDLTGLGDSTLLGSRGLLRRLTEAGWVQARWGGETGTQGRRLHLYSLTQAGWRLLPAARVTLRTGTETER